MASGWLAKFKQKKSKRKTVGSGRTYKRDVYMLHPKSVDQMLFSTKLGTPLYVGGERVDKLNFGSNPLVAGQPIQEDKLVTGFSDTMPLTTIQKLRARKGPPTISPTLPKSMSGGTRLLPTPPAKQVQRTIAIDPSISPYGTGRRANKPKKATKNVQFDASEKALHNSLFHEIVNSGRYGNVLEY